MTQENSLRVVFMGTPDFAVASLNAIAQSRHEVVGVVTSPDKPAGRGQKLRQSVVKVSAENLGVTTLQPTNLKDPSFVEELKDLRADVFVVVAFRMLPEVVWSIPPKGTFNLHGSLLPDYRGAAPINWAIMNGDKKTGVTTFFIEKEIDTGDIILQDSLEIFPNESAGELHDRMMVVGANLVVRTLDLIADGNVASQNQQSYTESLRRPAPKIFKADCQIDWIQPASDIHNKVRGLSPYPAAWTTIADKSCKVFAGKICSTDGLEVGKFQVEDGKLMVGTGDNDYEITQLQLEGKKRMSTDDFLRGMSHLFE